MKVFHTIRNYLCYCGIEKDEYEAIKKDAYVSNFNVWRFLHCLITAILVFLFIDSLFNDLLQANRFLYLGALLYAIVTTVFFFILRKDSILPQFWIYLTISILFLLGCLLTLNKPEFPATTFIVMLLITPMFMLDKPFFMGIELFVASAVFVIWMHGVKPHDIWEMDFIHTLIFGAAGFLIHVISNSIRIKEFVLTRRINIQKDTDELTGLQNKGALTRAINAYLEDDSKQKGILFILDIDHFKMVNDTYGHDVGDRVIQQLGGLLRGYFTNGEIVGRFGGDEFIFFVPDTNDTAAADRIAGDIVARVPEQVLLPSDQEKVYASIGIALYFGAEKNYSELFKKADIALYEVKAKRDRPYLIFE